MLKPINDHLLIEPLEQKTFVATDKPTYSEIGTVITLPSTWDGMVGASFSPKVGDKVYFDSWLAAKYPRPEGGFYWLVKFDDVRAFEPNENKIPE